MYNIHIVKGNALTVEKKPLALVFLYRGSVSLQTRSKFKNSLQTYFIVVNYKRCLKIRLA